MTILINILAVIGSITVISLIALALYIKFVRFFIPNYDNSPIIDNSSERNESDNDILD